MQFSLRSKRSPTSLMTGTKHRVMIPSATTPFQGLLGVPTLGALPATVSP